MSKAKDQVDTVLVLRTVSAQGKSHGGFQWPLEVGAVVEAPDWEPTSACGNGLHGLVDAEGDWNLLDWSFKAKALIVEVDKSTIIELGGKVKFPRAVVRQITTLTAAICTIACDGARIARRVADLVAEIGAVAERAASGDSLKLAASGDYSQLAASGDYSQLAASGDSSKLAASGDYSKLAASGYSSVAISAAPNCTAKAGANGAIALAWYDGKRPRITVGYVGEGLEADTWYRLDELGQFVRVEASA